MEVDATLRHEKEASLLDAYFTEYKVAPDWAFPIAPPIPFVGDQYPSKGGGVLVYASAENLGYAWPRAMQKWDRDTWQVHVEQKAEDWPWFSSIEDQMCRSRLMYKNRSEGSLVHIEPINNGSLLLAARHALLQLEPASNFPDNAKGFLNHVAVANPGKFSIRSKANKDYASKPKYWPPSLPFILHDLKVLDPVFVILPRTILATLNKLSPDIKHLLGQRVVLPNYQITSLVVRRTIKPVLKRKGIPPPPPFSDPAWPLSRGAERWGMEYYLQWLDVIAKDWKQMPTVS
ncbi:MAG: hypothetical protein JSS77_13080 [Acidobacteria bacterium]|nr:hypothetical protein [Acidobacteriota bacterium]